MQINLNIMDAQKVLEAHQGPSKFPDLVVRVTGFSAYFASLSPEFRQWVVNRILTQVFVLKKFTPRLRRVNFY
jgi:pyruvate-formate lyase